MNGASQRELHPYFSAGPQKENTAMQHDRVSIGNIGRNERVPRKNRMSKKLNEGSKNFMNGNGSITCPNKKRLSRTYETAFLMVIRNGFLA
jgi:hypothetical protein